MSLTPDYTTVPGQVYALISVVGPECPQKNSEFGLKIRGCFNTRDDAARHAKKLQKEDGLVDIYVVDMYQWLLIPPKSSHVGEVHYCEEKLEEIFSKYNENQSMAARMFEERKRDMMAKPKEGSSMPFIKSGDENSKYYTKPDEAPIRHPADVLKELQEKNPDVPIEELVKEADAIVSAEIKERKEKRDQDLSVFDEAGEKVEGGGALKEEPEEEGGEIEGYSKE